MPEPEIFDKAHKTPVPNVLDMARTSRALALADPERLIELIEGLGEIPPFEYLRAPQKGLVMIR
ncbi:MAG: phosphonate C-P lyase system protein PhnG, partial [Deltaproteobacteria bacterium]|nr:phosphonate C-P lyase system protein PhnG [Deltaproteobacteria bacterium]